MKIIMFYELADDGLAKVPANFPAHKARLEEFHARGVLLMAGPYGNPPQGALGIFMSQEAAAEFVKDDPFVVNGVVGHYTFQPWNEVLG